MTKFDGQNIYDENITISVGDSPGWARTFFSAFPAVRHKNYQLFFTGQIISLVGTWLQMVAQGWLVLQLTRSAFMVGLITALGTLPVLVFSLFGGVLVDRFNKKHLIILTQAAQMILAFLLALLTLSGHVQVWEIGILAFLLGVTNAVDMPARQAFVVEMVGKKDLASAIALNAGTYNGARVIGPAVAGTIIAVLGIGAAFLLNAVSFIPVIFALFKIRERRILKQVHPHPLLAIRQGLSYAFSHPVIKTLLLYAGITSIFGWSHTTIMPVVVQEVFHRGADVLGYFFSAQGLGAFLAALLVSAYARKLPLMSILLSGSVIFSVGILLFSVMKTVPLTFPFLFLSGLGLIMQFSTTNTLIQHAVADTFRGRVMSLYTVMFLGMMPIGSFFMGTVAEHFGSLFAIRAGAIIVLLSAAFLLTQKKKLEQSIAQA